MDRSIGEHKHEDHRFPEDLLFYKGQNLRKENINSYHQGTYVSRADSLIINLSRLTHASFSSLSSDSSHFEMDCDRAKDLRVVNKTLETNGTCHKIKQEMQQPPPPRRFVILNSYKVIVLLMVLQSTSFRYFCIFCKMDFLAADDFLDHLELHPNGSFVLVKRDLPPAPVLSEPPECEEPLSNSPISPEMLSNQIKV